MTRILLPPNLRFLGFQCLFALTSFHFPLSIHFQSLSIPSIQLPLESLLHLFSAFLAFLPQTLNHTRRVISHQHTPQQVLQHHPTFLMLAMEDIRAYWQKEEVGEGKVARAAWKTGGNSPNLPPTIPHPVVNTSQAMSRSLHCTPSLS